SSVWESFLPAFRLSTRAYRQILPQQKPLIYLNFKRFIGFSGTTKLKTATNKNNQNSPKRVVFLFLGGPLFNDQTGPPLHAHYQMEAIPATLL
ncbi:MAG: hypothetical protein NT142_03620, partial [Planctomycetota bacterium]|nr:hypothetical protein [Planctomycetota bacterium]